MVVCTLNSETEAGWNLGFQYIDCCYSTVIVLGISNEFRTETQSNNLCSTAVQHMESLVTCFCDIIATTIASVFRPH